MTVGTAPASVFDADLPTLEYDAEETPAEAEAASPRMVDIGGRNLRYLERGTGVPVLLLHGFGADLNSWMFTQPALAETHRTIALDLPGHGGSTKDAGPWDVPALSQSVVALLDALDVPKAHLVGHSLGGAIALATALGHPARVASLTLICPGGLGAEIDAAFIEGLIAANRRKPMEQVLQKLFADPALASSVKWVSFLSVWPLLATHAGAAIAAYAAIHAAEDNTRTLEKQGEDINQ